MKQTDLNSFMRKYFDPYKKRAPGHIVHDPGTTKEHRGLVNNICEWANENSYTYFTRVFLKKGKIADIVIPGLPYPFIEVRHSEKKKEKLYLEEYEKLTKFVDTEDPYQLT